MAYEHEPRKHFDGEPCEWCDGTGLQPVRRSDPLHLTTRRTPSLDEDKDHPFIVDDIGMAARTSERLADEAHETPLYEQITLKLALRRMMMAYERRIRSECSALELTQEPWRCAEFAEAEAALLGRTLTCGCHYDERGAFYTSPYCAEAHCLDCGMAYGGDNWVDVTLSDPQWHMIHPDQNGILCANCIVARVARISRRHYPVVAIRASIEFSLCASAGEPGGSRMQDDEPAMGPDGPVALAETDKHQWATKPVKFCQECGDEWSNKNADSKCPLAGMDATP